MREYRTRLVADVATGQLDVRPAASHRPAEPADIAANPTAAENDADASELEPA